MPRGNIHIKELCDSWVDKTAMSSHKTKSEVIADLAILVDVLRYNPTEIHKLLSVQTKAHIEYRQHEGRCSRGAYESNLLVCFALLPMVDYKILNGVAFVKWDQNYDPKTIDVSKIL